MIEETNVLTFLVLGLYYLMFLILQEEQELSRNNELLVPGIFISNKNA